MKSAIVRIVLLIYIFAVTREGTACEHGWLRYGRQCFKIYTEKRTQLTAKITCILEGSQLASLSSAEILGFLTVHLATETAVENKFWVGLTRQPDNTLVWTDGSSAENQSWVQYQSSHDWSLSLPGSISRVCFAYNGAKVIRHPCYSLLPFVCSHNASQANQDEKCRPFHEVSFYGEATGNCIFKASTAVTMPEAEQKCLDEGGYFLDIDQIIRDGITRFYESRVLTNDGSKYWTALRWNGSEVLWKSGNVLASDYPIPFYNGTGNCVTVMFNFTDVLESHLYQTECHEEAYVICASGFNSPSTTAIPQPSQQQQLMCPQGYNWKADRMTNYCYWETSYETNRLSWNEARTYCQSFGADLASFHTMEEEKIGLSFQYGSLAHPYWIGLQLDPETETYKWSDGSPLDYENWAPNHPDHKDKRLRCVAMDAEAKHWISTLCGIRSWFICKAPKTANPPTPVLPTSAPLVPCTDEMGQPSMYYFQDYCYSVISLQYSWHRAKQYCENEGSTLVSIHSDDEIGFLLKLLYENRGLRGNRVWIGLNSLGMDGSFRWTDWTPLDFTYWNEDEPNNYQNQEKCCNMYVGNGLWNDENCNAGMGFICKRRNDTSVPTVIPTTQNPLIGNCRKGWFSYHDRCYLLVGENFKDRANWTVASQVCQSYGGYLASIRNSREQAFLAYLMQSLKEDTWIGLHDTIQSGRYYWLDNSDMQYTNWAAGEPSFFGIKEDCVKMVYENWDSGVWKDDECENKLPFICQTQKDPLLPEPPFDRGTSCLHPDGWLKLYDMCFAMFAGTPMTWTEAESTCLRHGAHLVSVTGKSVQAVVSYLGHEVNETFWIGLRYKKSLQKATWLNEWPMNISKWDNNEPAGLSDDVCFISTSDGFWKKSDCNERMPFMCQITSGKPPRPKMYTGACPSTSNLWIPSEGNNCYIADSKFHATWYTASLYCFKYGSFLVSLHSMEDIQMLKNVIKPSIRAVFIGLMRNKRGGFVWSDDTPMDFVNWEEGQPENDRDNCVEMVVDTMKWKVTPCSSKRHFVCSSKKIWEIENTSGTEKLIDDSPSKLSVAALVAILVCFVLAVIVIVAAVVYYRPLGKGRFRVPFRQHSMSFENALFNVDTASMEFQDEKEEDMHL